MPRGNGGVIGPANIPTTSVAKGVWSLMEQQLAQRQGIWPTVALADPYFEYTTLLLPGTGTNGAQNNTFLDSSSNTFTVTRNGNTTQGTFSPFSQTGWGNYFDGTGDYLSVANNAALDLGSGDFTIEGWWYFDDTSNQALVSKYTASNGYVVQYQSGNLRMVLGLGASDQVNSFAWTPVVNTWYHIAITRSGTSGRAFVNGTQIGTTLTFTTSNTAASTTLQIGLTHTVSELMRGYVSNFRLVKGQALYTSAFTPSMTPLTTTSQGATAGNVSILTCQSNRFIDNSTNNFTITRNGDTRVVAFSPFAPSAAYSAATNGGSGYFDGSWDYLTVSGGLPSGQGTAFTLECWVYVTSLADYRVITRGTVANMFDFGITATGIVTIDNTNTGAICATSAGTITTNQWFHIALTRTTGNIYTIYVNGVSKATSSAYSTSFTANTTIGYSSYSATHNFLGYMSGFKVSSSLVYSTGFSVPTSPPTNDANTSLLLNFTNAGIYDATSKNDLETVGNAQISSTTAKWGSTSISFDGTGDWLLIPDQPQQRIGTGNFTVEMWVYRNSSGTYGLVGKGTGTTGWLVSLNSSNQVVFTYGSSTITSTGTISATTWTHIAVVREGTSTNQTKIYINGTNDGTGTVSTDFNQTNSMYVGADRTGGSAANAYVQDVRITNYARYTANFTAPTAAFPLL